MHVFLSHNRGDKDIAKRMAAQLRLVGVDVSLDDWEVKPGDSIVVKVNEALAVVDTVLVLWSQNAAGSRWVNSELAAALARQLADGSVRVVPIRLDDTGLPALLQHLKWLKLDDNRSVESIVRELTGLASKEDFIKAVQQTIWDSGLEYEMMPGIGVVVGCPECGAPTSEFQGRVSVDYEHDDTYVDVRCRRCGWEGGGEI